MGCKVTPFQLQHPTLQLQDGFANNFAYANWHKETPKLI